MINLIKEKNPMPEQAPDIRNKNFLEVAEGYTEEMAVNEAMRCLKCRKKPCMAGCPVMVKIPDFIAKVAEGEFEEAYQIISETSSLPAICGRVCPQETQCEGSRASRLASAVWKDSLPIGTPPTTAMRRSSL